MQSLRPVALGDQLAELIRLQIVSGELPPDAHMVEGTLAARHDVSRGPVRDALKALTNEGLLEPRRRGYFVKPFTGTDIDELYDIREAAEQLAARQAIPLSQRSDWASAEQHVDQMHRMARSGDRPSYAKADLAFHTEIYTNSRNSRLITLWLQYRPTFAALLAVTNAQDADLQPSAEDHDRLMQLALNRDVAEFSQELTRHLDGSRRRMHVALAKHHDLAEERLA